MKQPTLFDLSSAEPAAPLREPAPPDQDARDFASDPANDVVLEASAGTGKTRVLVDRYVRLLEAGVDPRNILAITFTRKAAAEMRDRVLAEVHRRAESGHAGAAAARAVAQRAGDIEISTIDAFCFSLLREFPLEGNVDPGFEIADETEMARFANEALDLTLREARALIRENEHVRLLFVGVKLPILRDAVASLLDRRQVALPAVRTFVEQARGARSSADAGRAFLGAIRDLLRHGPHAAILDDGPAGAPEFVWLQRDLAALAGDAPLDPLTARQVRRRLERYFLTKSGDPRKKLTKPFTPDTFASAEAKKRHEAALAELSPRVVEALAALDADVNLLLARGLLRVLEIAVRHYESLLEEHALIDFAGMLDRAVRLLERQEEFARSRLKLQARYHHVLVDEFQDTSRLQWRLVELLIDAWGEGEGAADAPTSIFVVGDRKQSIYRFRHAEVTLLDAAAEKIGALRRGRRIRQSISTSFRAVPELLGFVNALAGSLESPEAIEERFSYRDIDRFPVPALAPGARRDGRPVLGLVAEPSMDACAAAVAEAVERELQSGVVRDRRAGARPVRPDDIAILFRARQGHQYFESALESRGIRTYVYKGLGFFDAPEVQDLQALLRYLAQPDSHLRAAELLRSRIVRLSDAGLARLAPDLAGALRAPDIDDRLAVLDEIDRELLAAARTSVARWLTMADRVPPSEVVDMVLRDAAYGFELRGRRLDQARENLKKVRGLIRRVENRGYATLGRLAEYFETLRAGEESNAAVAATGAVNLMTIHAAKGLEYPIVFVVNLHVQGRGRASGFTVIDRGPDGEPAVAFGSSEATRLEEQRETEELRRLMYVAVTRARDRLYLAAEINDKGRMRRGARSLASLLPMSLADRFAEATTRPAGDELDWTTPDGSFAFRIWRAPEPPVVPVQAARELPRPVSRDLTPIAAGTRRPLAASATGTPVDAAPGTPSGTLEPDATPTDRLAGTLVHRLFERRVDDLADLDVLTATAESLLRPDERVDLADPHRFAGTAAKLYRRLRQRADVKSWLAGGRAYYEVPFSSDLLDATGRRLRGQVDCLIVGDDGAATILEFKTGRPRPEHASQAALYARAVADSLGLASVRSQIVYPEDSGHVAGGAAD
jgi:ATP-dependent helicase/nuclease subunit A